MRLVGRGLQRSPRSLARSMSRPCFDRKGQLLVAALPEGLSRTAEHLVARTADYRQTGSASRRGIGDHTSFFLDREETFIFTDSRPRTLQC